ncbi:MAG: cell division protein ZapA [Candidatus Aegiribacteria sp.]|nr:cell division protein ZapA [Candidatus Aegiribacteria sp.]
MSNRNEVTRVNIFGREYTIRGAGSPAYISEIAHYVDMKMRQMTDNATMASTAKVAIFAALNIADELYQKREKFEELEESQSGELTRLADRMEQVLSETAYPSMPSASPDSDSSAMIEASAIQQNSTSDIPR